ncbi:MAG: AbrB/MazE/SpoVT family DNA-binding domain-containing protein [Elusimicrobiota bacterium]|nr:MAG: AbrB/MazE/SpoVT family DNA-binding domain-containing protein [Elusimicrobiota bacterium]
MKKKMMTKQLTRLGNSLALVIDKPILELLGMSAEIPLQLTTDGTSLIVTPVFRYATKEQVDEAIGWVKKNYGEALRRLGDPSSSSSPRTSSKSTEK